VKERESERKTEEGDETIFATSKNVIVKTPLPCEEQHEVQLCKYNNRMQST